MLVLLACRPDSVVLRYRFDPAAVHHYTLTVTTTTSTGTSNGPTQEVRRVVARLTETVLESSGVTATVEAVVTPRVTTVDGLRIQDDPGSRTTFEILSDGTTSPEMSENVAPRIPLPRGPVTIGSSWDAPSRLEGDDATVHMSGRATFLGFEYEGPARVAMLELTRTGTVRSKQVVGQAPVELSGTSRMSATSKVDYDEGSLIELTSVTRSAFVLGSEGSGTGTLTVTVRSSLKRAG